MKQTLRNPAMKALTNWFKQLFDRRLWQAHCNYEDDYYGDQFCKCEEQR